MQSNVVRCLARSFDLPHQRHRVGDHRRSCERRLCRRAVQSGRQPCRTPCERIHRCVLLLRRHHSGRHGRDRVLHVHPARRYHDDAGVGVRGCGRLRPRLGCCSRLNVRDAGARFWLGRRRRRSAPRCWLRCRCCSSCNGAHKKCQFLMIAFSR